MNRAEFKRRWELNDTGDGITMDEVAECARKWGLYHTPRIHPMDHVLYAVLRAAECADAEEFNPDNEEE